MRNRTLNFKRSQLRYTAMSYHRELAIEYRLDRGNRIGCLWCLYSL